MGMKHCVDHGKNLVFSKKEVGHNQKVFTEGWHGLIYVL